MNEMMKTGNAVIDNYIELAKAASASGNNEQCELYRNKILEIESGNVAAWALKGHSAGWQSSLRAARVNEMLVCYGTAMQHAMSPELKLYLSNMANEDYMDVVRALLDLQCDRFRKWPDAEELGAISALCVKMLECGIGTLKPGGVQLQCMHTEQVDDFRKSLATKIGNCACETEAAVRSEYESSNNGSARASGASAKPAARSSGSSLRRTPITARSSAAARPSPAPKSFRRFTIRWACAR